MTDREDVVVALARFFAELYDDDGKDILDAMRDEKFIRADALPAYELTALGLAALEIPKGAEKHDG